MLFAVALDHNTSLNYSELQNLPDGGDLLRIRAQDPEIGRTMSLSGYGTRILELWDVETDILEEKAMFHHVATQEAHRAVSNEALYGVCVFRISGLITLTYLHL